MNFLSALELSEIGTNGTIIAVIAFLTMLGFVKGAVKLVFLLFTIAGACYAAYWGSEEGLTYLKKIWLGAPIQLANVFAVICGVIAFYFLSKVFRFFTNPFENNSFISRVAFGVPAAMVSFVAALGLIWLSLNFLKEKGSLGELQYWVSQDDENQAARYKSYPTLSRLKQSLESSIMGEKISELYMLHEAEKHSLAKLLVIGKTSKKKFEKFYTNKNITNVVQRRDFDKLMKNKKVRNLIADNDIDGLLEDENILKALEDKELVEALKSIAVDDIK